jgi:hypothetical protein
MVAANATSNVYTLVTVFTNATVTPGIWRHIGPFDFTKYQGGNVSILIEGSTPIDGTTGPIYLDDVSLRTGTQILTSSASAC